MSTTDLDGHPPGTRHILMRQGTGFRDTREWTGKVWVLPGQTRSAGKTPEAMARDGWLYEAPSRE
jgi:hypothetical protein